MCFKRKIVWIILCIAVVNLFFGITKIKSDSMVPTLWDSDRVLYFRYSSPERFGIFFIDDPKNEERELVKRIINLPGERIQDSRISYIVPQNHYYVLGDNRGEYWGNDLGELVISLDSRSFGPVPSSSIHERVVLVFWPPENARWLW